MPGPGNALHIIEPGYTIFDGVDTFHGRTFQAGAGVTITNPDGLAGNTTIALTGGGLAIDSITVDANTVPGSNPVVPSAAGSITIEAAAVAAHSVPIETRSRAVNSFKVEVQESATSVGTDATKSGISHFDSARFTVDANGFVSINSTGVGETLTADSGGNLNPISGNWNILGGPGITTLGTGATITINSVVFTDTAATTLVSDNGYNATAAGTYVLPATALQGELIILYCDTAGAVVLDAPALNFIRIGSLITSSGGTCTSTSQGDSLTLRYRLSSLTWECTSCIGTWIVA